mmetsp:Transcript_85396/g.134832  ORF Transcript_85396/g.134832 Transcript_85396/m.134832 type:complete len:476 (+) Transcript_85396:67-1494(+)
MFARARSRSPPGGFGNSQIQQFSGGLGEQPLDAATFLRDHIIDNEVLQRFLALDPQQQDTVMRRGPLNQARNPSAVLSSRISQVITGNIVGTGPKRGGGGGFGGCGGGGGNETGDVQQMKQMMMMMMQMMGGSGASGGGGKGGGMGGMSGMQMGMRGPTQGASSSNQGLRNGDWYCAGCGDHQFAKNSSCRQCGAARPDNAADSQPPDIETFLMVHADTLQEHTISAFRALDPAVQHAIVRRGSLNGARDPNAVLMARMKEARFGGATAAEVDPLTFISQHEFQQHAVEQFLALPDEAKVAVMSAGSLDGARDKTAVLISRMAKAKGGGKGRQVDWFCNQCGDLQFARNSVCRNCGAPKPTDGSQFVPPDPMSFLGTHPVEDHAKQKFWSLSPELQAQVIQKGSLAGARDPTAVLMARIRQVSGMGNQGMMMGGMSQGGMSQGGMNSQDMEMQMQNMMQQMMMQMMQSGGMGNMQ